jgi:predicted lipoprotein with Yx(FWY)xxD motif
MIKRLAVFVFATAVVMAGCGGGGGGSTAGAPVPNPNPTLATQGNIPVAQTVAGSPGFVNPANNRTLYFLDVDTASGATCTGACVGVWPVLTPTAGSTAVANMTLATRSDGTGQQWSYEAHPLYMYAGDNGPNQANGEGVPDFGGHWHVARPNAAATAPPGGGGGGGPGCTVYC